jgi:hypothetical protein
LLTVVAAAQAQAPEPRRGRAPLAGADDLEPAVDVGAEPAATEQPAERSVAMINPDRPVNAPPPIAAPQPARTEAPQPSNPRVVDTLDLGTTSITGNQELPKVLYIVPWKKSDLGDLVGRPVNTLLDEVLAPVDPEVFERHLDYYESLHRDGQKE